MTKKLFGTSGIRGDAKSLFTKEFCFDIGRTFVEFLKRKNSLSPIAIGMDPRESSSRIKSDLFLGLKTAGVELFDEGVVPIPSINWLIINTLIKSAIMVTGSHLAPNLNGVKFYAHNEEISYDDQVEIEKIYYEIKDDKNAINVNINPFMEDRAKELYTNLLLNTAVKEYPSWRVAVDCANGGQSVVIPKVLKSLGLDIIELNCDIESNFIARDTDTDDKAVIKDLEALVVKEKCDFGIAFDGDGDRVVFIDEKGQFVQGEYSCSIMANNLEIDSIVTPISSSQVVDRLGKNVFRTKVGSPYVIAKMKEVSAMFGFEPNGGAIFADTMYTRDGGSMAIKMLNLFKKYNSKFSEMIATLPKYYMFRTKVEYKWELKDTIINKAKTEFKGTKTEEMDGLKIWLDDSTWILFRSSVNAPEFRVFAESSDETKAKDLLSRGMNLVNKVLEENQ